MHHTFCRQIDNKSHKATVQKATTDALIQLYNDVIDMPDGAVKRKFLEKVIEMCQCETNFWNGLRKIKLTAGLND